MNAKVYRLRLASDAGTYCFTASERSLRGALNNAFLAFVQDTGEDSATLELYHHYHGWHRVYVDHIFIIIKSPINLDYPGIARGVRETYADCDGWLTDEEKLKRRAMLLMKERALEAKIRRNRFTVVES